MLLIFQINKTYFHMNNYLFSLGDDVISAYISGIQFLPVCLMYSSLCPEGAEGTFTPCLFFCLFVCLTVIDESSAITLC